MRGVLDRGQEVDALDVLRAALLSGWRWQVMQPTRDAGASWAQIGAAAGIDAHRAEAEYIAAVEHQARLGLTDPKAL